MILDPSKNIDGIATQEGKPTSAPAQTLDATPVVQNPIPEKTLLAWSAPSFDFKDKGFTWYAAAGFIILAFVAYFIWQADWFGLGIIVVVSAILFWYAAKMRPTEVNYSITGMGIYANEHFYPFAEIHSFWIIYNEKAKNLHLAFIKKYLPALVINLNDVNPVVLRNLLLRKLPEQEKKVESLLDKVTRLAGF